MAHRGIIATLAVLVLFSSVPIFRIVNVNFTPQDDQSEFDVSLRAPEGASLEGTEVIANAGANRPCHPPHLPGSQLRHAHGGRRRAGHARLPPERPCCAPTGFSAIATAISSGITDELPPRDPMIQARDWPKNRPAELSHQAPGQSPAVAAVAAARRRATCMFVLAGAAAQNELACLRAATRWLGQVARDPAAPPTPTRRCALGKPEVCACGIDRPREPPTSACSARRCGPGAAIRWCAAIRWSRHVQRGRRAVRRPPAGRAGRTATSVEADHRPAHRRLDGPARHGFALDQRRSSFAHGAAPRPSIRRLDRQRQATVSRPTCCRARSQATAQTAAIGDAAAAARAGTRAIRRG